MIRRRTETDDQVLRSAEGFFGRLAVILEMELFFRGGTEYWFHEFHHDHGDDGEPDELDRIDRNIAPAIGNDLRTHGGEHGNRPGIEWLPSQDVIENAEDASHEKPVDRQPSRCHRHGMRFR